MKLITICFALMLSLFLTACGGGTEPKKAENEQKATPATVANSNTANLQNRTTTKVDADRDADDLPADKPSSNSNVTNSKSLKPPKKDADDINKKGDADDKNRKSSTDKYDDDDDK
jgi:hypothetical protein